MKIRELIKELEKFDLELPVYTEYDAQYYEVDSGDIYIIHEVTDPKVVIV